MHLHNAAQVLLLLLLLLLLGVQCSLAPQKCKPPNDVMIMSVLDVYVYVYR